MGARGWGGGGGCKGRWLERRAKGRIQESFGEWDGWDRGRVDIGTGTQIS